MPDPNPYEPPQSELRQASSEISRATTGSMLVRYLVPVLIGGQIAAVLLIAWFGYLRDLRHGNYQQLQGLIEIFMRCFFGLGVVLLPFGHAFGSLKLMIGEIVAMGLMFWWILFH